VIVRVCAGDIAKALTLVAGVIDDDLKIPVLQCVLIEPAAPDKIKVTAHALHRHASATIAATDLAESDRPAAVHADGLRGLTQAMPPDSMLTLTVDGGTMIVAGGRSLRSDYRFQILPSADFPVPLALGVGAVSLALTRDLLIKHLALPSFAISVERARYYLTGLFLHAQDGVLISVATDGVLLCEARTSWPDPLDWSGAIIPGTACAEIVRLARRQERVTLRISDRLIEAASGDVIFASKLIEGRFPDYKRLLPPASTNNQCEIARKALLAGFERLNAMLASEPTSARKPANAAGIAWDSGGCLSLSLPRRAGRANDLIEVMTVAGTADFALSIERMTEVLEALPSETVRIEFTQPGAPVRVAIPGADDLLAIIMPVRV
jgi:DNA polymerase-3 subunit beta